MKTSEAAARWLLQRVKHDGFLDHATAVFEIERRFGAEAVYLNRHGNPAIDPKILRAFRKLSSDSVVWERGEQLWRRREDYDPPGRVAD